MTGGSYKNSIGIRVRELGAPGRARWVDPDPGPKISDRMNFS
jgi:hypothetical protein